RPLSILARLRYRYKPSRQSRRPCPLARVSTVTLPAGKPMRNFPLIGPIISIPSCLLKRHPLKAH
ncbi:hypothetical protein C0992_002512, partial [Termitomyces sp. T32_za158]